MRRTRKHNKNYRKTRKGGMNSNKLQTYPLPLSPSTNSVRKVKTYPLPPESSTNSIRKVKTYLPHPESSTNSVRKVKTYPPLPESPTNRVGILTNNESLIPPKKESNEYKKRHNRLMKVFTEARKQSLVNRIFGRKRPEPKLNSQGYPKSFFSVNNNKVGFKP